MPDGATRLVSLHDPDARPIRKGRIGRPVEFGYKAQVTDNPDGIVADYTVMVGNPPDAPLLVPAIGRVIAHTHRPPRAVTADRGYGEAGVEREVAALGVAVRRGLDLLQDSLPSIFHGQTSLRTRPRCHFPATTCSRTSLCPFLGSAQVTVRSSFSAR